MATRGGAVHVATTKRVYKGKTYVTHLLRRSIRKGTTVTHETLGNLSHLPDHLIEIIKRSLKGETFVPAAEAFRITRSLPHGHVERRPDDDPQAGTGGSDRLRALAAARPGHRHDRRTPPVPQLQAGQHTPLARHHARRGTPPPGCH